MKKWAYSFNEEDYKGLFNTREEAITEMKAEAGIYKVGYVGEATEYEVKDVVRHFISASQITEYLADFLIDDYGEYAGEWAKDLEGINDLDSRLKDVFTQWLIETKQEPTWFNVYSHEEINLENI